MIDALTDAELSIAIRRLELADCWIAISGYENISLLSGLRELKAARIKIVLLKESNAGMAQEVKALRRAKVNHG